jgi:hypothetical protein
MLNVAIVDMHAPTAEQRTVFETVIEQCWLESQGLPLFVVNGKCVQGYGPIEESHPDLKYLIEAALSDRDRESVAAARAGLAADPVAYKAKVDADLAAGADKKRRGAPVGWRFIAMAAGVIVLGGIGFLWGRNRKRKFEKSARR